MTDETVSLVRVLKRGRALISKGWCKGPFAVNSEGDVVPDTDKSACKWCAAGAKNRAIADILGHGEWHPLYASAREYLNRASRGRGYITVNERARKVETVIALYDRAIALAEKDRV